MNDYTVIFANHALHWRRLLAPAGSVQIVVNRSFGSLHRQPWLADLPARMLFHSSKMARDWGYLAADTPLGALPVAVLAPPVDLSAYFDIPLERPPGTLVIGRLAGDADVPDNAATFYGNLAKALPDAEFRFMPSPANLVEAWRDHSQFRFLARDEMTPPAFLAACHIYALAYSPAVPVPGPRSLMEAMAAGCAPVVIDRDGPRDRVVHGESGFRSNDDDAFTAHVVALATDPALRRRIANAARERARPWGPAPWVEEIVRFAIDATTGAPA